MQLADIVLTILLINYNKLITIELLVKQTVPERVQQTFVHLQNTSKVVRIITYYGADDSRKLRLSAKQTFLAASFLIFSDKLFLHRNIATVGEPETRRQSILRTQIIIMIVASTVTAVKITLRHVYCTKQRRSSLNVVVVVDKGPFEVAKILY